MYEIKILKPNFGVDFLSLIIETLRLISLKRRNALDIVVFQLLHDAWQMLVFRLVLRMNGVIQNVFEDVLEVVHGISNSELLYSFKQLVLGLQSSFVSFVLQGHVLNLLIQAHLLLSIVTFLKLRPKHLFRQIILLFSRDFPLTLHYQERVNLIHVRKELNTFEVEVP